jgi:nucleotide-binding universal stress UspA family protein
MYGPIILPLDGSELAEVAVPHAIELAHELDTEILVVRAIQSPAQIYGVTAIGAEAGFAVAYQHLYESVIKDANTYVARQVEALRNLGLTATGHCQVGIPADVILDVAAEYPKALIVIASHGRSGVSRWAFGSVADRVLHAAPVPVIVIRAGKPVAEAHEPAIAVATG